jgi:hypothetical protein
MGRSGKGLILSQNFQSGRRGGFQVDSPVKTPVARKLARCAPPYTFSSGEEPEEGAVPPLRSVALEEVVDELRYGNDAGHQKVIPSPCAGDIEQVTFRVVDLLEVRVVSH